MTPIEQMPRAVAAAVCGVLTDIDDTLTTHGRLTAGAYAALEALAAAGMAVIPVTGRPAGWCDHLARMRPVTAVVGENGAFNDEPLFAHFPNAVGVANVLAFRDRLRAPPRYVTRGASGEGFQELARFLLAARADAAG